MCGLKVLVCVVLLQFLIFSLKILDLQLTLLFFDIFKFGGFQDLIYKREIVLFEVVGFMILVRVILGAVWTFEVSLSTISLVRIILIRIVVSTFWLVMPIVTLVISIWVLSIGIWIWILILLAIVPLASRAMLALTLTLRLFFPFKPLMRRKIILQLSYERILPESKKVRLNFFQ